MAVYSWSRNNGAIQIAPTGLAVLHAEMQVDAGFSASVLEINLCTFTQGNNSMLIERATVNGVMLNKERGQIESEYTDDAPGAIRADGAWFASAWIRTPQTPSTQIAASQPGLRRWVTAAQGNVTVWAFPRGLKVIGGGPSLCIVGGGTIVQHISIVYEA